MRASEKSKREGAIDSVNVRPEGDSKRYQAGDLVPATGVYEIIHHGQHRRSQEVVFISGDHFPGCEGCGKGVRFRHLRTVPYIFHDEDFADAA